MQLRVLLLLLSITSTASSALINRTDRVLLMGDSEAFLLKDEIKRRMDSAGIHYAARVVPGSSVIQWARELHGDWSFIYTFKPNVLLVSLGANDACMGTRIVQNERPYFTRFLKRAGARRVIWIGPPAIGAQEGCGVRDCMTRAIEGLEAFSTMARERVTYLDARSVKIPMWDDLLHPSPIGRAVWSTWLWERLTNEPTTGPLED
jgi:hypothetical protein